ncbi:MAG: hypothetical protein WBI07_07245 [Mobilitalea sp.]
MVQDETKLSLINNMVLLCSEDYFINNKLIGKLNKNELKQLKKLCYGLEFAIGDTMQDVINNRIMTIRDSEKYPNLLDEKFQIE